MPGSDLVSRRSLGRTGRKWLYLVHRWIGIASCLLFAMWFVSGLVMLYVPYPSLSLAKKLAGAEAIRGVAVDVPPPIVGGRLPERLSLEMRDGVPVWRIDEDGTRRTVAAARGAQLVPVDAKLAARVAGRFGQAPVRDVEWVERVEQVERDQWTVAGGYDKDRPLWRVDLADAAATSLYVSSRSGSVVQRTTRHARAWNWVGSVPHWLYPTILRRDQAAWRQVVLWVSGPCIAAALAGMWIGILRTRIGSRRFKGGRMTPYHGWMLWHHVAGMVGGVFLVTWIFSGWLSVDPGRVFQATPISEARMRAYASGGMLPPIPVARIGAVADGAKRLDLIGNAGMALLVVHRADGGRDVLSMTDFRKVRPLTARIVAAARDLVPDGRIMSVETLNTADMYWYEANGSPVLPVLRIRFNDAAGTWLYIDPATGALVDVQDSRRRLYRWLFDLLHKWDLNLLTGHRPFWDVLVWLLSAAGLVTSISGVTIGWRRLRRPVSRNGSPHGAER